MFPLESQNLALPSKRVLIVDDHVSVVEMVEHFLNQLGRYRVVGTATTIEEAAKIGAAEKPDIIILDLILGGGVQGLRVVDELRRSSPLSRYLIYSGNLSVPSVRLALAGGVMAIVDKGAPLNELRMGLESVAAGQAYYSSFAGDLVRQLVQQKRGEPDLASLTPRERSVLGLLAEGLSSKEIASRLGVSVHTVVNHRSNLMRKTGLHRVAQLARYAAETGLLKPAQSA